MDGEVLEAYVRQLMESHRAREVTVAWQGGEPTLMGLDFFRRSVELVERYRRPGVRVSHTIQTNGTLVDQEWAAFFKEHGFLVGISIDGPEELHDAYRVDRGGGPTFRRVMRGLGFLREHGVEYNTLTTVHRANAFRPVEVYRFLRDICGSRFVQFIPIVERVSGEGKAPGRDDIVRPAPWSSWRDRPLYRQEGRRVTDRSVTPEAYGEFLVEVFDEWIRSDVGTVFVQMFDAALANWVGEPAGVCVHSPTCGLAPAMEHNGDVYACDHFVEPDYKLGNILDTDLACLVASPRQRAFGRDKLEALPGSCLECDVRFTCHGGCPKDRFLRTADGEPGLNYLCAGYKRFFHHVDEPMRAMADLLRRRRPPAEVMGRYRGEEEVPPRTFEVGRNHPCPCGSGRKFKQCHGRPGGGRATGS
jgi:uncharacterized protein